MHSDYLGSPKKVASVEKVLVEKLFSFKDTVVISMKIHWQIF